MPVCSFSSSLHYFTELAQLGWDQCCAAGRFEEMIYNLNLRLSYEFLVLISEDLCRLFFMQILSGFHPRFVQILSRFEAI